ncbi:glycoside hydrolase family 2 TIM barrel-domain containing protein [Desertivirga arenae]|uniref:glycoside hydrolase family 2 TIM barrel-domain containing protein n=1 Tax=Desertivirga arenae TaxID=2810309 RepID=UPI001F602B11|nr:glycoside hydrolase family 2 TIM barrel-domain containing protein [Pedobacter sp. SYSU D00823]
MNLERVLNQFEFRGIMSRARYVQILVFIITISVVGPAFAQQGRLVLNLSQGWYFTKDRVVVDKVDPETKWERINLPHSWNTEDVVDDTPDYYRAACWYKKELTIDKSLKGKKIFLQFEGANQVSHVYINGKQAATHTGGYTAFIVPADNFLNFQEGASNTLLVKVDNSHNDNIPPLSADFTFFGGIYRNVNLIINNQVHFQHSKGTSSVFVSTPSVSEKKAYVLVKGVIENQSSKVQKFIYKNIILDASGKVIKESATSLSLRSGEHKDVKQALDNILSPSLWSPENPYLYRVVSQIKDAKSGDILDQVVNPLGVRWFRFDGATGFHLNGKPYKLIGASRHQDFKGMANAIPENFNYRDVKLLKDMGGNFLRVAHYPQDQAVLNACDMLGILTSVEIPVVNAITETEEFSQNCRNMQVEMIRQNYNHPSVVLWGYMNEIMLRPKFIGQAERQKTYFNNITRLAQSLDSLTRAEDPSRYTMIAHHGDFNRYKQAGLIDIPQVVGWNLYQGWYSGSPANFGEFLDRYHKEFPEKPTMITEYGADADPRIRASNPERFDKSIQYSLNFHDIYLKAMMERPFVAAGMIWNLADFNSETREETMPHINNKGLLTLDRVPKDLYRFYQSQLLKTPYLSISDWRKRSGEQDSASVTSTQELDVFSNSSEVELFHSGRSLGHKKPLNGRFTWLVPFTDGQNQIEARTLINGKEYRDVAVIDYDVQSPDKINHLNLLLGAKRSFEDDKGQVWIPSNQYKAGSWGYIGGKPFKLGNARQSYGTDRDIKETPNDPVYQTQVTGIQKYKLDLADGEYSLTLHFAELTTSEAKEALAYNLDNSVQKNKAENRVFNISVNKIPVFQNFDISKRYGPLRAGYESLKVVAEHGKGIEISFNAIVGQPVLNALQVTRIN